MDILQFFQFQYYIDLLRGSRHFNPFLALFLISLLWVLYPSYIFFTKGFVFSQTYAADAHTLIERVYPDELKITIEKGVVRTNVPEPYYITVSPETFKGTIFEEKGKTSTYKSRLLAIDTKGKAEDFDRYQSAALLTERSLVYYNDGNVKIYSLRETDNMEVTKDSVRQGFDRLNNSLNLSTWIRVGIAVIPFLLLIAVYVGYWLLLLFYALFVFLMMKIFDARMGYGRAIAFTGVLMMVTYGVVNLIALVPTLSTVLKNIFTFKPIFLLVFAYLVIFMASRQRQEEAA